MTVAGLSKGRLFREAVQRSRPLQVLGTVNAYCARLAQLAGAKALYVSGSGVATASHGLPDLGITTLQDVVHDVACITRASSLPVLVDVDTGFGSAWSIARCVRELHRAGAAALHIEDQVASKRCGHRPGKQLVDCDEMVDRIRAAVDARNEVDPDLVIMARTDAIASEGIDSAIDRCKAYIDAGADMLFPEACTTLEMYQQLHEALPDIPLLANITEFGQTPLFHADELYKAGASIVLYPLSAHRAMAKAAQQVYESIIRNGHQEEVLPLMQTRDELYKALDYHSYERKLDELFAEQNQKKKKQDQNKQV